MEDLTRPASPPFPFRLFLVTSSIALAVYLFTLAPDLTWANYGSDGGELITASVTLGVPHPPGYPTYVLLGKLFSFLPVGSVAARYHLFSALCLALASGFVSVISFQLSVNSDQSSVISKQLSMKGRRSSRNRQLITDHRLLPTEYWSLITAHGPLAAGLTFAFMPLVWGQALITEVYALNLLALAAFLWALLSHRPVPLIGLLLGLAATTHLTSLLMLPLALGLTPRTSWPRLAPGFLLGLAPLLALPLLALGDSPVVWGDPATLDGWWWLVSARIYRPNVFAFPAGQWVGRLVAWSKGLFTQFAWLGFLLLPAGISQSWPRHKRRTILLLATAALYALYAFTYNAGDAAIFFLPGLLLLSILLTEGVRRLRGIALLLPLALLLLNFSSVSLNGDHTARTLAAPILQDAPPAAILLTDGDRATFTLWYFQHVEGHRPDLTIVDSNLFAFPWYRQRLGRLHPRLRHLAADDLPGFRVANGDRRPICSVTWLTPTEAFVLDCDDRESN